MEVEFECVETEVLRAYDYNLSHVQTNHRQVPTMCLVFEQMFKLRLNIKETLLGSGTAQWQSSCLDAGDPGFNPEH